MSENYGTIWVRQDCMLHHANGECGGCHDDEHGHDEEPLSAIGDGFHVSMGMAEERFFITYENGEPDSPTYRTEPLTEADADARADALWRAGWKFVTILPYD